MPKQTAKSASPNRYLAIIEKIFITRFSSGALEFDFSRSDIERTASVLKIELPKNLGDLVYTFRYRVEFPSSIRQTAKEGFEWIIEGAGRAKYRFKQVRINRIVPKENLLTIKIPDATPEIIAAHALSDEQALLAKVRYNRLIDIFLGITASSLQNICERP